MSIATNLNAGNINMGTGSHSVGGNFTGPTAGSGYVNLASCDMTVVGDIDLRNLTTVENESTITLIGSGQQLLYFGGSETSPNEFGDLIVNKPGGIAVIQDDWWVANFVGTDGDFDFNGKTMKVGH